MPQEFRNATIREADFSRARLDFFEWHDCTFERVCFDHASLQQVRLYGCHFNRCSFRSTDLRDASLSVGSGGAETEFVDTAFHRVDFRGATGCNLVFRSTSFHSCKLDRFVFDGPLCDGVAFLGKCNELTFRGTPKDSERNQLRLDLSRATVKWLNADYGIDLRQVVLPEDGSCLIIQDRIKAIEVLATRLCENDVGQSGYLVAKMLRGVYSERALSPLELSQDTVLISKAMIADFAETDDVNFVSSIFALIRSTAEAAGHVVR